MLLTNQWGLCINAKPFKFFMSSMTHVHKLDAHTNHKFHVDKGFRMLRAILKAKVSLLSASYQSFTGSVYGLVCFYNKCVLIKVAPKVHSNGIITPTKNPLYPHRVRHYFSYKSIAVFIVEIAIGLLYKVHHQSSGHIP